MRLPFPPRFIAALGAASLLAASLPLAAADVVCGVGAQVEGEMSGGKVGTIAEVGTESPHVGWYRITYDWSPGGEWFDPRTWALHPQGRSDRCVVATAAPASAPAARVAPAAPSAVVSAAPPSSSTCPRGKHVVDRQQQRGEILGERNGMCVVQLADGSSHSYLRWMLEEADAAPAAAGLPAGTYVCSAGGAGIFRITLDGDAGYTDRAGESGRYTLDAGSGALSFASGSLAGYHARALGPGKFGLATEPTTMFYTICNLKR